MPLPPDGYGWKWVNADGTRWRHRGDMPAGWFAVPAEFAARDTGDLNVSGGAITEKTQGEKDAETLVATRTQARSRLLASVTELLASQEVKARLNAAGKSETLIDARIATLDSAITNALGNHP